MRILVASVIFLSASCRDHSASTSGVVVGATTSPNQTGARAPRLTREAPEVVPIDNLDAAPQDARERIASAAAAIEGDRKAEFLAIVSTGGFVAGSLALSAEQVEAELAGRTVAELTNVRCDDEPCRWSVRMLDPRRVELVALASDREAGGVVLIHDDDGAWAAARARP